MLRGWFETVKSFVMSRFSKAPQPKHWLVYVANKAGEVVSLHLVIALDCEDAVKMSCDQYGYDGSYDVAAFASDFSAQVSVSGGAKTLELAQKAVDEARAAEEAKRAEVNSRKARFEAARGKKSKGKAAIASALLVFALATAAYAQELPEPNHGYAPRKAVMALDYPPQGQILDAASVYFAGWAFVCDGSNIHDWILWVWVPGGLNGGGFQRWPISLTYGIARPDVAAFYKANASICKEQTNVGFHFYPTKPLPVGAVAYAIQTYVPAGYFDANGNIVPASANVNTKYLIVK